MTPRYKLLALDIDDTIVPRNKPMSQRDIEAIQRARAAGVYVTLATGRGFLGSSPVWKQLGLDTLIINYGGAMINDAATGKPFFVTELQSETVVRVLSLAEEMGLHAHLYQGDCIVYGRPHPYAEMYSAHLSLPSRVEPNILNMVWRGVPKVLIITEPERVKELLPFFAERFRGECAVSASSPGFIEFNRIGASKGSALELIAAHLGIDMSETAAVGDNTLDSEMIKAAGLGACVENGSDAVKAIADVIVPSCEEGGAAYFIDNYII